MREVVALVVDDAVSKILIQIIRIRQILRPSLIDSACHALATKQQLTTVESSAHLS